MTGLELDYIEQNSLAEPIVEDVDTEIAINLDETLTLFMEEAEEHLTTIHQFLNQELHQYDSYNALIRALHTLRGSSAMAQVETILKPVPKLSTYLKYCCKKNFLLTQMKFYYYKNIVSLLEIA